MNTTLEPLPLVRLSDTSLALAREADDIRGRMVLDDAGYEMGRVEDLVIDDEGHRVYFMILRVSGFIPGDRWLLIPVDAIRKRDRDHVYVDQDHERAASGPEYDPALVSDPGYQASVFGWYGFVPYWHPGFVSSRVVPFRLNAQQPTPRSPGPRVEPDVAQDEAERTEGGKRGSDRDQ